MLIAGSIQETAESQPFSTQKWWNPDKMFSTCPFVPNCSSVRLSFCYQNCERDILKMSQLILMPIGTSDGSRGQEYQTMNFGDQEIKGQEHTKPKTDLEAWRRHDSRPLGSSDFLVSHRVILWVVYLYLPTMSFVPLSELKTFFGGRGSKISTLQIHCKYTVIQKRHFFISLWFNVWQISVICST